MNDASIIERELRYLREITNPVGGKVVVDEAIAALKRLTAEVERLRAAIREHNGMCDSACDMRRGNGSCAAWRSRAMNCPDCPEDWRIEIDPREPKP